MASHHRILNINRMVAHSTQYDRLLKGTDYKNCVVQFFKKYKKVKISVQLELKFQMKLLYLHQIEHFQYDGGSPNNRYGRTSHPWYP